MNSDEQYCGLLMTDSEERVCFLTGKSIQENCGESCVDYIEVIMDDDEPFSPEYHLMTKEDIKRRKSMQNIRGMKL